MTGITIALPPPSLFFYLLKTDWFGGALGTNGPKASWATPRSGVARKSKICPLLYRIIEWHPPRLISFAALLLKDQTL